MEIMIFVTPKMTMSRPDKKPLVQLPGTAIPLMPSEVRNLHFEPQAGFRRSSIVQPHSTLTDLLTRQLHTQKKCTST